MSTFAVFLTSGYYWQCDIFYITNVEGAELYSMVAGVHLHRHLWPTHWQHYILTLLLTLILQLLIHVFRLVLKGSYIKTACEPVYLKHSSAVSLTFIAAEQHSWVYHARSSEPDLAGGRTGAQFNWETLSFRIKNTIVASKEMRYRVLLSIIIMHVPDVRKWFSICLSLENVTVSDHQN